MTLKPFYQAVQAHYDLCDEFFALFLDPSMIYSCAYFAEPQMTLAQAQLAKADLSLDKCDLQPGMTLLDVGCGWGAVACRAAERYKVNVIGLTLSRNQQARAAARATQLPAGSGTVEIRLQGWEEFDEPVDRIISIGAFEHFRLSRHSAFFTKCQSLLSHARDGRGRMLLHTILLPSSTELAAKNLPVTHENVLFAKFIRQAIFPGGQLCPAGTVMGHATAAGFNVERTQSLQLHYALTLEAWARNLEARRAEAIALTTPQIYDTYMKYLTGCAERFRSGHLDVMQFTLTRNE